MRTDLVFTSLDHFSISVLHTEDLLAVERDHQNWAVLHHLPHRQVQRVDVEHPAGDHQPHGLGLSDRGGQHVEGSFIAPDYNVGAMQQ